MNIIKTLEQIGQSASAKQFDSLTSMSHAFGLQQADFQQIKSETSELFCFVLPVDPEDDNDDNDNDGDEQGNDLSLM